MIYLLAIGLMFSFTSCTDDELQDAVISYEIIVLPFKGISAVEIDFNYLRAIRTDNEGRNNCFRTVNLSHSSCDLSVNSNWSTYLGKETIDPQPISAFDLKLGSGITITKSGVVSELKLGNPDPCVAEFLNLEINPEDQIRVTFALDLNASEIKMIDGIETLIPVFETLVNRNYDPESVR